MVEGFYKQVTALLRDHGFTRDPSRGKGSHELWRHQGSGRVVIVPKTRSRHTANRILRDAGLEERL